MKKFKVGDIVRATNDSYGYTNKQNEWVGKVTKTYGNGFNAKTISCSIKGFCRSEFEFFYLSYDGFELVEPKEIHITTDGKTTYAVMRENGKVIKRSEAKCSPEDEFDFEVGAKLAFDRLFEKPFVPHLEYKSDNCIEDMGEIGKETSLCDTDGNKLYLGDVVIVIAPNDHSYGCAFVVRGEDNKVDFVMGIESCCKSPNMGGWKVYKVKSCKDISHNEKYDSVVAKLKND